MKSGSNAQATETKISTDEKQTIGKPTKFESHTEVYLFMR